MRDAANNIEGNPRMKPHFISTIALTFFLAACGGESSDSDAAPLPKPKLPVPVNERGNLTAFKITSPSGGNGSGQIQINPGVSDGSFVASWKVKDSSSDYGVAMALSTDKVADKDDAVFYYDTCGASHTACPRASRTYMDCSFNNSNVMQCAGDPTSGRNMTAYLDTLPWNGYILIETCSNGINYCTVMSRAVQLQ